MTDKTRHKVDVIEIHVVLARPTSPEAAEKFGLNIAQRIKSLTHAKKVANVYVADVRGEHG